MGLKIKIKIMDKDKDKVIGYLSNKREKRDTARQASLQGNNSWAKVRKISSVIDMVTIKKDRGRREKVDHYTNIQARKINNMEANATSV